MIARKATASPPRGERTAARAPRGRWARWSALVVTGPLFWLLARCGALEWLVAGHHPVRTALEGLSWPATVLALLLAIGCAARRRSTSPDHPADAPGSSVVRAAPKQDPAPMSRPQAAAAAACTSPVHQPGRRPAPARQGSARTGPAIHGEDLTSPGGIGKPVSLDSHSEYWDEGNKALRNVGHIIAGNHASVTA